MIASSSPVPIRYVLVYQDQRVPLPDGDVVVGRSMSCQVRFNAPTVSRQHVLLQVRGETIVAENLSTSTGTLLNGRRMAEPARIAAGDTLTLGPRQIRIDRAADSERRGLATPPRPALGLLADESDDEDETVVGEHVAISAAQVASFAFHTCPTCRASVPFERAVCPGCGHVWAADSASTRLGQTTSRDVAGDVPMPAQVMAIYASEAMTIDVTLSEIRPGGAFVPTELLDAPGTACELTLLPEGQAPLVITGAVVGARANADDRGAPGLEVRFDEMTQGVRLWIDLFNRANR